MKSAIIVFYAGISLPSEMPVKMSDLAFVAFSVPSPFIFMRAYTSEKIGLTFMVAPYYDLKVTYRVLPGKTFMFGLGPLSPGNGIKDRLHGTHW